MVGTGGLDAWMIFYLVVEGSAQSSVDFLPASAAGIIVTFSVLATPPRGAGIIGIIISISSPALPISIIVTIIVVSTPSMSPLW